MVNKFFECWKQRQLLKAYKLTYNQQEFLPPVVLRDTVYMVTKGGAIYAMRYDQTTEMEKIMQIRF